MRAYGKATATSQYWYIRAEPQVRMVAKRIFPGCFQTGDTIRIPRTAAAAENLEWFLLRYPLEMSRDDSRQLRWEASESKANRELGDHYISGQAKAPPVKTALPLRDYQQRAVALAASVPGLILADDLGLGKTAVGLGLIAGRTPAIVVCQTHLQAQWAEQAAKFVPGLKTHTVRKTAAYKMPAHDILIIPYSKLASCAPRLKGYKTVVFDEAQEIRHKGTGKYNGAAALAQSASWRIGLTATPIYNYGGEIWNVADVINPGCLGSAEDFANEWCTWDGRRYVVTEPEALGSHLAESHIMLRRRREDVGRELPPVNKIVHNVEFDEKRMQALNRELANLARVILSGSFQEKGQASRELDIKLRQATGVAKAPFVADAVADMVEAGERVLLGGWHREVYSIWQRTFKRRGIKASLYTGSELPRQKAHNAAAFAAGETDVMCMSLRSGAGVDGLQANASIVAIGELDWSPQVLKQFIGRLNRDGQPDSVTAIYFVATGGSDPVVAGVLGLKEEQSHGLINPGKERETLIEGAEGSRGEALARKILSEMS